MIAQFPTPYPDELLYSQICRYHIRSGNYCATFTVDDIYHHRTVHPDFLYLNAFTDDGRFKAVAFCMIIIHSLQLARNHYTSIHPRQSGVYCFFTKHMEG